MTKKVIFFLQKLTYMIIIYSNIYQIIVKEYEEICVVNTYVDDNVSFLHK